jgi:hypothetical protein
MRWQDVKRKRQQRRGNPPAMQPFDRGLSFTKCIKEANAAAAATPADGTARADRVRVAATKLSTSALVFPAHTTTAREAMAAFEVETRVAARLVGAR